MTQTDRLLQYLQEHGSITGLEALAKLGIIRCASRIHDLRKAGVCIQSASIPVINRFGEKCSVKRYTLMNPANGQQVNYGMADTLMGIFGYQRVEA